MFLYCPGMITLLKTSEAPSDPTRRSRWNLWLSVLVFMVTAAGATFAQNLGRPISSTLIFVLGVTVIGAIAGLRGGLVAAIGASAIYNFFLSEPILQFTASTPDEYVPLIAFNLCAIISGILAGRLNDRARLAENAKARLDVLLTVSAQLQKVVVLPDISAAMNDAVISSRLGAFELYDANGAYICDGGAVPRWASLAARQFGKAGAASGQTRASAYRLEGGGTALGVAIFGWPEERSSGVAVDMEALLAMLAMAVERCLLLEQLSQTEAIRRSEEFKTALLSSLSHDMRTPLSAISASASSLLSLSEDLEPAVRTMLLRTISEQCERLDRYTANLLDLGLLQAGIDEDKLTQVDIIEILGAVLRSARTTTDHVISKQIECESAIVRANPVMVEQILGNILDNAMRYSEDRTAIAIKITCADQVVQIEIMDEGCGIPASELPQVFNRFYRSNRTLHHEGHGLGLSIAKGFIEAFGGSIRILSPYAGGLGTQVIVTLPLAQTGGAPLDG